MLVDIGALRMQAQKIIRPNGDNLKIENAMSIGSQLLASQLLSLQEISIDLSGVRFIEPYFMVSLISLLSSNKIDSSKVKIICPVNKNCLAYLWCSGFLHAANRIVTVEEDRGYLSRKKVLRADTLIPLTEISNSQDVSVVRDVIRQRLNGILKTQGAEKSKKVSAVISIVTELCQNIMEHANTAFGWIAAQKYDAKSLNSSFVRIAIADAGCGIRNSLIAGYPEVEDQSDAETILRMLKDGLSCRGKEVGGMGYRVLRKAVDGYGGSFSIHSMSGRVWRGHRQRALYPETYNQAWPGTYLYLSL